MGGLGSGKHRSTPIDKGLLTEAIIAIADAEEDYHYRIAWCRFWITLRRMGFKRGPPKNVPCEPR